MKDADFITGLMRRNTNELGFIPNTAIARRFVPQDLYLIQRNRHREAIGYLLHGPVHPDGTLYIHQACIELDRRHRGFGHKVVTELIKRAISHKATRILLRCAADLQAVHFWRSRGFQTTAITPGGARRQRSIIQFELILQQHHEESDAGRLPDARRPNV